MVTVVFPCLLTTVGLCRLISVLSHDDMVLSMRAERLQSLQQDFTTQRYRDDIAAIVMENDEN
jgi:hypothetical protein